MSIDPHPHSGANVGRYLWAAGPVHSGRRNIHQSDGRLNHQGLPRLLGSCPNIVLKHYESSDHLWDAPDDAALCPNCFAKNSKTWGALHELLNEVRLLGALVDSQAMDLDEHREVSAERVDAIRRLLARGGDA